MISGSEIIGLANDVAASAISPAFEDSAEGTGVRKGVGLGRFLIYSIALGGVEANGIGVAVGGSVAGGEAAGDAGIGVTELGEALVERALTEEFVETVVGDVVADEKHPLDVVAYSGGLVRIGGCGEADGGLATIGGASSHDGAASYAKLVEPI